MNSLIVEAHDLIRDCLIELKNDSGDLDTIIAKLGTAKSLLNQAIIKKVK